MSSLLLHNLTANGHQVIRKGSVGVLPIQSTLQNNKGHPHLRWGHIPSEIAFNFLNKMSTVLSIHSSKIKAKFKCSPLIGGIQFWNRFFQDK